MTTYAHDRRIGAAASSCSGRPCAPAPTGISTLPARKETTMRSIILLMLLAVAGHSGGVLAAERVTLIYSGNVDGELEPCGCSPEGNLGSVRRTSTLLDLLRADQTNLFAVTTNKHKRGKTTHGRLTNEFILKGYA